MESFESRSREAESQADRLADEGERVGRRIDETKGDLQSKKGQLPGMETLAERDDPVASGVGEDDERPPEEPPAAEAEAEDDDEPNATGVD